MPRSLAILLVRVGRQRGSTACASGCRAVWWAAVVLAVLALPARAAGPMIPAPQRTDMVYDHGRDILYIANGSSVLRYHLGMGAFLSPFVMNGAGLLGIDLSPDGSYLVVADNATGPSTNWVHVIDLRTGMVWKQEFPRSGLEGGTYAVAFGNDGACMITGRFQGSGAPIALRRFEPATGVWVEPH